VGNSGNFVGTLPRFWTSGAEAAPVASPFDEFMRFSDWFHAREGRHHAIALSRLVERVFEFLVRERGQPESTIATALARDAQRTGQKDVPAALRAHVAADVLAQFNRAPAPAAPLAHRQARHAGT
jgi:hypothetical protein